MARATKKPKLSNAEAWAQATEEVRKRTSGVAVGPVDDGATMADMPGDDSAFWDEVEKRAVQLGGRPAGPAHEG